MCGIGGFLTKSDSREYLPKLRSMANAMAHRGPDGEGFFNEGPCALSHRLLRIYSRETLPGPYQSRDKRWVLTFNGEIYNHEELRKQLEQVHHCEWRFNTDAEVLLEGWAHEGESFLQKINGMFAFAIWDRKNNTLILGRDRVGEKPLYFSELNGTIVFASEIKALKAFGLPMKLNERALSDYLRYRYVPGPETLFSGIEKLLPGHLLFISPNSSPSTKCYWSLNQETENKGDPEGLFELLSQSHKIRLRSAWNPGILLSGGIDSSTIASFMPRGSSAWTLESPMTINEMAQARLTCEKYGLEHKSVRLESLEHLGKEIDETVYSLEEPLGDSIILATRKLAEAISKETRVIISGEGADEIFGGYVHHWAYAHLARRQKRFKQIELKTLRFLLKYTGLYLPTWLSPYPANIAQDARWRLLPTLDRMIAGKGPGPELSSLFNQNEIGSTHPSRRMNAELNLSNLRDLIRLDLGTWLPDYTLTRLDKLMMSYGVESRLPFLDHRTVEYALALPESQLIRARHRKWILRAAMEKHLGAKTAWRKKTPFIVNMAHERGPNLQSMALEAIKNLRDRNFPLSANIDKFTNNKNSFLGSKKAFSVLVLDSWARVFEITN